MLCPYPVATTPLPFHVHRSPERRLRVAEVVDVLLGELDAGQPEEAGPADALDPLAHPLVGPGVRRPHVHQLLHRVHYLRPPGRVVREERDRELREAGFGTRVADLAAHPDGHALSLIHISEPTRL